MLQKSIVTGLFFALGIGLNSPIMLIGASIAICAALISTQFFQLSLASSQLGIYGFNAALVSMAIFYFLPLTLFSFTLTILAGMFTFVVMRLMQQKFANIPVFTFPFIITTWIVLILIEVLAINVEKQPFTAASSGDVYIIMRTIAQVMFQDYWLSGAVFIAGLLLHSVKVAAWAVIGAVIALIIARVLNFSEDWLVMGLYGFNASLTAIALSARYTKKLWPVLLGIALSVLLTKLFEYITIPMLTTPFVLASWIIIALVRAKADDPLASEFLL